MVTPVSAAPPAANEVPTGSAEELSGDPREDGPVVAILPLVVEGELPDADREALSAELVEGLRRGEFGVVTPGEVAATGKGDCAKAGCMQDIASQTGATHLVRASVEVIDRDYTVAVELYAGADGSMVVTSSDGCEICGVADVGQLLATQAATLRTKLDALASGPSTVDIRSDPEGADVTLDGEPFGVTPLDKPVLPGEHVIRVSKEGYITIQEQRTFVEGVQESLSYELERVPNRLPRRPWGWATLSVGIVALGGAGVMMAFDGRPVRFGNRCSVPRVNVDGDGDCRQLWQGKWPAFAAGIAGGALVALGAAILVTTAKNPRKRAKREAAVSRLRVSPSGVGIAF